jgi:hypothetical protein
MKKLAFAALFVLVALALLLLQLRAPASTAAVERAPARTSEAERVAALTAIGARETAQRAPGKLDPQSDAFFYRFDEAVPPALTAAAAGCYTGGLHRVHRNAKVKLGYTIAIADGVVSIHDVHVVESTVADKTLEQCFAREVAGVTWRDDELPDWRQPDELVIRPERGMKKFTADNLAYRGDGRVGALESAGVVAASRELPVD